MANKDLRYFMREEAKVEQIVTVPGLSPSRTRMAK